MKCLWCTSLLLFAPTGNKEINKGLNSGTSSFAVSAASICPDRAVFYARPVVWRLVCPIISIRRGLSLWRIQRWAIYVAPRPVPPVFLLWHGRLRTTMRGLERHPFWTNQIRADQTGIADCPMGWSRRREVFLEGFVYGLLYVKKMPSLGQNYVCAWHKKIFFIYISPFFVVHRLTCP